MSVIMAYSASCGAAVNFHDDSYKNSAETELAYRREDMMRIAEQIAQENDLRRLRETRRRKSMGAGSETIQSLTENT